MHTNRLLVLIGGLLLVIGARLPWISVPVLFGVEGPAYEAIAVGWEGDGIITGGIGFLLLLEGMLIPGRRGTRYALLEAMLAALAAMVVVEGFYRMLEINPSAGIIAATDVGLYVTLLGALLALVGAVRRSSVQRGAHSVETV